MTGISRRDFIRVFGISIASLLLTRCKFLGQTTPTPTTPREILRSCWTRFTELATTTQKQSEDEQAWDVNALGAQLTADHRRALDELVAAERSPKRWLTWCRKGMPRRFSMSGA